MNTQKNIIKYIYLFFLGFLGFSTLGQYIVLEILHSPVSLMEIYYIPLLIHYRKKILVFIKKSFNKLPIWMIALNLLLLEGIIMGIGLTLDLSILLNYRPIIYMFFIIFFIKKFGFKLLPKYIFFINLSAILGEITYVNFISSSEISSSSNCVAIALCILTAFVCGKYIWGCLAFFLGGLLGITSGYRMGIIITIACFVEALIYMLICRERKGTKLSIIMKPFFIGILITILAVIVVNYEAFVQMIANKFGMSHFAIFRVTDRLRSLFKRNYHLSQDIGRLKLFAYPINRFFSSIFPRGLIGESIGEYWLYIDMPILYLYDLFGSIATVILLTRIAWKVIKNIKVLFLSRSKRGDFDVCDNIKVMTILMMPILLCLGLVNGSFIANVYQAIETACILGVLLYVVESKNLSQYAE